jgi:hypothetical protein
MVVRAVYMAAVAGVVMLEVARRAEEMVLRV